MESNKPMMHYNNYSLYIFCLKEKAHTLVFRLILLRKEEPEYLKRKPQSQTEIGPISANI